MRDDDTSRGLPLSRTHRKPSISIGGPWGFLRRRGRRRRRDPGRGRRDVLVELAGDLGNDTGKGRDQPGTLQLGLGDAVLHAEEFEDFNYFLDEDGAAADPEQRRIQQIRTLANPFNGIRKAKLLVIMTVHPDTLV